MAKNLLYDLRNVYINLASNSIGGGYLLHKDLEEKALLLKNESADRYRKSIIEKYAEQSEIVRRNIDGKLKFSEVGEPIVNRTMQIYELAKQTKKGYNFKREEVFGHPSCLNSINQLGGVVNLNDHFGNKRILSKSAEKVLSKFFTKDFARTFLDGIGGLIVFPAFGKMLYDGWGGSFIGLGIGAGNYLGSIYPCFLLGNTPESVIEVPAERLKKNLVWMDDCFDRIYRGKK